MCLLTLNGASSLILIGASSLILIGASRNACTIFLISQWSVSIWAAYMDHGLYSSLRFHTNLNHWKCLVNLYNNDAGYRVAQNKECEAQAQYMKLL